MFNKKIIFILVLLIISLGTISSVNANANDEDFINDDVETFNLEYDDINSLESSNKATFTELQNLIDNATEGSSISLNKDYCLDINYHNSNLDNKYGISISKSLSIEGNGHEIDGLSKSNLYITGAKYVAFSNVTFKNWVSYTGNGVSRNVGAIYLNEVSRYSFVDCNFINMKGTDAHSVITSYNCNSSSFLYCNFTNTSSSGNGGSIFLYNTFYSLIDNCNFINTSSSETGGAIFLNNVYTSSIVKCSFNDNYASNNRDFTYQIFESYDDFSIDDYISNITNNGGSIVLDNINNSFIDYCKFNNNFALGSGGVIFFKNVGNSQVSSSNFVNNFAVYGGTFYSEYSNIVFKDLNISDSHSYNFGGVIVSRFCDIEINDCNCIDYQSLNGVGGAIYIFKGSSKIFNSSFVNGGISVYGGAIANSQSNLTVLSSKFINNTAGNGGAIYSIHGNVHVNDSFFNNSCAKQGSAIFCMLSYSLTFTNNIFLNSTGGQFNIYTINTNKEIIESGNHFENLYHVRMEYSGFLNGEQFTVKSNVLNYVISNTGKYLNNYDNMDFSRDESEFVNMEVFDSLYPNNSTIFGNYNSTFMTKFNFNRNYYLDDLFKDYEFLNIYLYSDSSFDTQIEKVSDIKTSFQISMNLTLNKPLLEYDDFIRFTGNELPVSSLNSSKSDLINIPSHYDSRDYGYVTPAKDQGDAGNCWAFAGLATLETCIKKATGITYDFSENNLKNLMAMDSITGLNKETNTGGDDLMVLGYLNSWLGPVNENLDSYDIYSSISPVLPSLFHIQNIKFLSDNKDNLDFKRAIMDYGAISVTFPRPINESHAVSIVGWIDNYYGLDSFGNYAKDVWIFKNSWGSDWGDNGFGYLSFDVDFLSDDIYSNYRAYTFIFDKHENYFKNYQYDYSGLTDYLVCEDSYVYYKNTFNCNENSDYDELLVAFSTYFNSPTNYTVAVYINDNLVLYQSGYSEEGYYTIPFNSMIDIKKDDTFTIVVVNHNEGDNYVPICQASETTVANIKPNNSFFSFDGKQWFDLYNLEDFHEFFYSDYEIANTCQVACIKAFTVSRYSYFVSVDVNKFDSIDVDEKITIDITVSGNQFYFNTLEVINNTLIILTINGKDYYAKIIDGKASLEVNFDKGGVYNLSTYYSNNLFLSYTVEFNFTVNKKSAVLSANDVSKVYGGSETSIVTLKDNKGNLIKEELILFDINGKTTKFKTNAKGQVKISLDLIPKTYLATITFAGNDKYLSAKTTVKIIVKKATPKLKASKKTFKLKTKMKKYTVTLKDNLNKILKNIKITLTISGKKYVAKTNKKGQAIFKIKLNKKRTYKATVSYAGNDYYNAIRKKVSIIIKK